jgi:tripartite-type tricarboxylate transporter receptor subunit TctC
VRALGVTTLKRVAAVPDIPTISEQGLKGFETGSWFGMSVPTGTPKDIIDRLHKEIVRAIANPKISQLFVNLGTHPVSNSPDEFSAFIKAETEKWGKVIRSANITAD